VIRVAVTAPLGPRGLAALCEELGEQLARAPGAVVVCELGALARSDIGTIGVLARLRLTARREGSELVLHDPRPNLLGLIELSGLSGVLRVEPRREAEQREQALRVEERVEMGDPPVV